MRICICGSMAFAKDMLEAKRKLDGMNHEAVVPCDTHDIAEGRHDHEDLEADYRHCMEKDIMKRCFRGIEKSDAILVLNPFPPTSKQRHSHEVRIIQPVVLNEDLGKISKNLHD